MNSYFDEFLDRHYIDPEPINTLLRKYGFYDSIARHVQYIVTNDTPKYQPVVSGLLQPIQDKLKDLEGQEKKRTEEDLGGLFRNLIADLCQNKTGFYSRLPEIVNSIRDTYEVRGDDFAALDELIGFNQLVNNLKDAVQFEESYRTRRLNWVHKTVNLSQVDTWMKNYGLLTDDSNFADLFNEQKKRRITVPAKYLKRFTLIVGRLIENRWIRSIGGKGTYRFIQDNILVQGRKKPLSKNYMKQTIDNFKTAGVGEKKHKKSVDTFVDEIHKKSML